MQESKEFFRSCPSHGSNCFKIINTCFPHLFQRSKPLPESSQSFRANPLDMIKDRNKIALSKVATVRPAGYFLPNNFDTVSGKPSATALKFGVLSETGVNRYCDVPKLTVMALRPDLTKVSGKMTRFTVVVSII